VSRYDWPGEADPSRKDRKTGRREFDEDCTRHTPDAFRVLLSQARAELLANLPNPDKEPWLPLGPSTVLRGQAGRSPRVSGRVRDIAVSDDGQRVYVASANGGVWYSSNAGTTWSPLGGWAMSHDTVNTGRPNNILTCGCLLVRFGTAPDHSDDSVLVGTGELRPDPNGLPGGQLYGIGVLVLSTSLPLALADPRLNPWTVEARELLAGAGIYRLASDPTSSTRVVAATSIGLFARDAAGAAWTRVVVDPFHFVAEDGKWCTDVLWTPSAGTTPARLWVTLVSGTSADVYVSENGLAGPFKEVTLHGEIDGGRLGLAASPTDPSVVYMLGAGPRLWRLDGTDSHRVDHLPKQLFGQDGSDFSYYDLAIAVHPTQSDRVALGGSAILGTSDWEASLFDGVLTGTMASGLGFPFNDTDAGQAAPNTDPTFIGSGVHADVHVIRYVPAATGIELWIGCDGGVFRSRKAGARDTFVSLNTGLATLQPGYVASHPTHDGVLIAGTQDNGIIRRVGDTIWEYSHIAGDGGGVAFHPSTPEHFVGQYTYGDWYSSGAWVKPVHRDGAKDDSVKEEDKNSAFYSGVAVFPATAPKALVALGTNRIWLSENWDPVSTTKPVMDWKTLPSGEDPRKGGERNTCKDKIEGGKVIALRWGSADRLYALMERAVVHFTRKPQLWGRDIITWPQQKPKKYKNEDIAANGIQDYLPPVGFWSDIAIHDLAKGSLYVSTTGRVDRKGEALVEFDRMDTLWWFDGNKTWYRTNLRGDTDGRTKAPALAVTCDPDDPNIVYVATSVGVWRGTLTFSGATPTPSWRWEPLINGLPEATVEDLVVFKSGSTKLLRAALRARGVWECDLSATPLPVGFTYLRAHPFDTRRTAPSPLTNPLVARATYAWDFSPDVAIRPKPGGAPPARPFFPVTAIAAYSLWVFQTALHALDPLVRPTGLDSDLFQDRVKAFRVSQSLPNPASAVVDKDVWDKVMQVGTPFATPWEGSEPTEADLAELVQEDQAVIKPLGVVSRPSVVVSARAHLVDVLVHHRHTKPIPASDVSVILVQRRVKDTEDGQAVALSDVWKAAVVGRLAGSTPAFDDGWQLADAAGIRHPAGPVDARSPRAATFELGTPAPSGSQWLLLAIVSSSLDPVTTAKLVGATVRELALSSHHVGARFYRVS